MKTIKLFGKDVPAELHHHLRSVYADDTLTRTIRHNTWQLETAAAVYDVTNCHLPEGASLVEIAWLPMDKGKRSKATFNAKIEYANPDGEGYGETLARIIERGKKPVPTSGAQVVFTHKEFSKLAQAKHKELAQVWQARAGDDVVAFEAATLWVTLQSWRAVGKALHKNTGKTYSPEGARKAARRFYDVVVGPGKITSDESARAYYTRERSYDLPAKRKPNLTAS